MFPFFRKFDLFYRKSRLAIFRAKRLTLKPEAIGFPNLSINSGDFSMNEKILGKACFVLGFLSIAGSIAIWFLSKESDVAHGERFGIFVGLWAPTFFTLSNRWK